MLRKPHANRHNATAKTTTNVQIFALILSLPAYPISLALTHSRIIIPIHAHILDLS